MTLQLDDFSHAAVSTSGAHRSWFWLYMVEAGVMLCLPLLVIGGLVAFSLPFTQAVGAIGLSCLVLGLLTAIVCFIGVKTRLTTALIAEQALGSIGAKLISIIILVSFLGWWGFQTEIMAQTFDAILANQGWHFPRWLSVGVCGIVMITTSVLGSNAIGKVAYVLVPIKVVALLVLLLYLKGDTTLTQLLQFTPPTPLSFGQVVGILVGGVIIGVVGYPDLARFLKTKKDAYLAAGSTFSTMAIIYLITMVISIAYNTSNIVLILPTLGFAPLALILVFFATWAANDKNLYGATIGISAFTNRLSRAQITMLAGAIGVLLAYIGIFNNLVTILTLLGVATSPIAPIYVWDYFSGPKVYQSKKRIYIPARWPALTAWVVGIAFGLATTPATNYGLGLFNLTTAPAIDAFLAALCVIATYSIVQKSLRYPPLSEG